MIDLGNQIEQTEVIPVLAVLLRDIKILVVDGVGWSLDLNVTTGAEWNFLTLRYLQA